MGIEATGKVYAISETKQVSDRFSKREFVLELADNPKYPQLVAFEFTGDRCAVLDDFSVGDQVRVEFQLRGREWRSPNGDTKYFNTLSAWSLDLVGERRTTQRSARGGAGAPLVDESVFGRNDDSDIPF
jgi:single-stranded DNA-binding protein